MVQILIILTEQKIQKTKNKKIHEENKKLKRVEEKKQNNKNKIKKK
jgi:hypothetical protein